jgi:alkyl sulfatase BDS1-like metallo-beta-lactamase superfamily hydrolase
VSTNIELEFENHVDLDFLERGFAVNLIRVNASVQLQTEDGWTGKYKALVDTGNPISIVPSSLWRKAKNSSASL